MASWAVGVTTVAERRKTLLPQTLASLRAAGWTDGLRLFVDGDDDGKSWREEFGLDVTCRGGAPVRVAANWLASAVELWYRDPHASHFLLVQDDVLLMRDLRSYLESCSLPEMAYFNLFTYRENEHVIHGKKIGWYESAELQDGAIYHGRMQQSGKGALALVFPHAAFRALLGCSHMTQRAQGANGWRSIDGGIVESMNQLGFREFVHAPTLSKHIGIESTIILPKKDADGVEFFERKPRCQNCLTWMGSNFSAMQFLEARNL
jgi:hypothetical protein